ESTSDRAAPGRRPPGRRRPAAVVAPRYRPVPRRLGGLAVSPRAATARLATLAGSPAGLHDPRRTGHRTRARRGDLCPGPHGPGSPGRRDRGPRYDPVQRRPQSNAPGPARPRARALRCRPRPNGDRDRWQPAGGRLHRGGDRPDVSRGGWGARGRDRPRERGERLLGEHERRRRDPGGPGPRQHPDRERRVPPAPAQDDGPRPRDHRLLDRRGRQPHRRRAGVQLRRSRGAGDHGLCLRPAI
ncbi:MAG: hypothetical protein AVDCRST_MAG33-3159, partial [uncultured Thermomicrobiales bacterium]